MRTYRTEEVTVQREIPDGWTCDGCGQHHDEDDYGPVDVTIVVNEGEEGGGRDEYEYCDACLIKKAPALKAAGSRAFLVTGDFTEESRG